MNDKMDDLTQGLVETISVEESRWGLKMFEEYRNKDSDEVFEIEISPKYFDRAIFILRTIGDLFIDLNETRNKKAFQGRCKGLSLNVMNTRVLLWEKMCVVRLKVNEDLREIDSKPW